MPRGLRPSPRVSALLAAVAMMVVGAGCLSEKGERGPERADDAERVPGAIVVDFVDGTTKGEFDEWEKDWGVDLEFVSQQDTEDAITVAVGVEGIDQLLERIRTNDAVEAAEPMFVYRASFVPNDPGFPKQWNLKQIGAPEAWDASQGKGVVVAVLDTGIAYENYQEFRRVPDLAGTRFVEGYDFVNQDGHPNDDHGHGTHVAGTIAQATDNGEGVAGVAFKASLMPLKVLDHFGSGTSANIADAIRWAADHGARVLNLSLGGGARSEVVASAVRYARKKGAVVVCAAGNTGRGQVEYPAAYDDALAVGAVGPTGALAPYSAWGKALDLLAPGGDKSQGGDDSGIVQNTIDPRDVGRSVYASYQGTSMAAPHVAGVAALLFAQGAKSPDEVEKALYASATPMDGQSGWSERAGHGLLNAGKAMRALGAGTEAEAAAEPLRPATLAGVAWSPLWLALGTLCLVLLTIGRRERPGYLNILVTPAFLVPLLAATVGFFFVRWLASGATGVAGNVAEVASLPIPDWERIIFGRGKLANPLFYSALIPVVASVVAIKAKGLRSVVAGLAIGFAGFLAYAAWSRAPGLAYLPFSFLAIPWLVVNALICALLARAMLRREV